MLLLQGENDDDGNIATQKSVPTTTLEKRKVIPQPISNEDKPF
jgi:hypothetical protein